SGVAPGWGGRGLVLAGLIAAIMSTVSGLVNSTSTIFATEIYQKSINPTASEHRLVVVGQTASLTALVISACLAPLVGIWGIFTFFQNALVYVACPFMVTALAGMLWKRMNYPAALFGFLGGIVVEVIVGV